MRHQALQAEVKEALCEVYRMRPITFMVHGQCQSMKNRKIPTRSGIMIKSAEARKFEEEFLMQIPADAKRAVGSKDHLLHAIVVVYYRSWRSDLETALIYDLLEKGGVISNDRYVRRHTEIAYVDPHDPRVHITITDLPEGPPPRF